MDPNKPQQSAAQSDSQRHVLNKGKTRAQDPPSASATDAASEPQLNLVKKKSRKRARQQAKQTSSSAADTGKPDQTVGAGPASLDHFNNNTRGDGLEEDLTPTNLNRGKGAADMSATSHLGPTLSHGVGQDSMMMDTEGTGTTLTKAGSSSGNRGVIAPVFSLPNIDLGDAAAQSVATSDNPPAAPVPTDCDCPVTAEGYGHFCQHGRYSWEDFIAELEQEAAAVSTHLPLSQSLGQYN